jgi:hypothetical protein
VLTVEKTAIRMCTGRRLAVSDSATAMTEPGLGITNSRGDLAGLVTQAIGEMKMVRSVLPRNAPPA